MKKVLVFDIYGEYAHFRKYFTNMSPTTFLIPPRTVIAGIIGAILGIDKRDNPEKFLLNKSLLSVGLRKAVNKAVIQINGVKADSLSQLTMPLGQKRQINYEFVKQPLYRIYFSHNDPLVYSKMKEMLSEHKSFYSIALGSAQCLANYNFIGEFDLSTLTSEEYYLIKSVIPVNQITEIDFSATKMIQKCTMPNEMLNNREVTQYEEYVYSINEAPIRAKVKSLYSIKDLGENICGM